MFKGTKSAAQSCAAREAWVRLSAIGEAVERTLTANAAARALPRLADVPRAGTEVRRGDPLLTALASGRTVDECRRRLDDLAKAALGEALATS